ncbi:hypothetical protein E3N88_21709 [Mikania micrantha]|uniref:Uncharacterized protein n=1 Tax=Mikania micrantha TaxID=192012 RepID=A0A5N6NAY0_9ASTR|nr:hypothetical protein E3N88_21709 [Mikania micrantha]
MENHGSETRTSSFIKSTKSGMLEFMVVFVAATVNAIVISFLISLAAVGGFYVDFFACMEIMYLGFLFITAFVTFTIPMSSIIVALVAAGLKKVLPVSIACMVSPNPRCTISVSKIQQQICYHTRQWLPVVLGLIIQEASYAANLFMQLRLQHHDIQLLHLDLDIVGCRLDDQETFAIWAQEKMSLAYLCCERNNSA